MAPQSNALSVAAVPDSPGGDPNGSGSPDRSTAARALFEAEARAHMFPDEPAKFTREDLNRLMIHLTKRKSSDIHITTDDCVRAMIHGSIFCVTERRLTRNEVEDILDILYGPNGTARIKSGEDVNNSYELKVGRNDRYRFRVNATGGRRDGAKAIQITVRTITAEPPTLDELNIEEGILKGLFPKDGVVTIAGQTGSGKTTTLAGAMRSVLEDPHSHKKIISYEQPIEYVYEKVSQASSFIFQTEIGLTGSGDLESWERAVENAMRRAPGIILLGETRDRRAVEACIHFSQSGHATYTTFHANSVADTVRRMANFFPSEAQGPVMMDLLETMRLIVWQRLFKRTDGRGRIAVREYLVFDDEVRDSLLQLGAANADKIIPRIKGFVRERGRSMIDCARAYHEQGLLSDKDMLLIGSKEA